jgi:hypothetical protein
MPKVRISSTYLRRHDPQFWDRGREQRFVCPFCGLGKPMDNNHRSLCLNLLTNAWVCHRCRAKGKLVAEGAEVIEERNVIQAEAERQEREAYFKYLENLKYVKRLHGTAGALYLEQERHINPRFASYHGVRYSPYFYGSPAVLFTLRDLHGKLVAINGRYINEWRDIKHRAAGDKHRGLFVCHKAFSGDYVYLCEAPLDALSLSMAGFMAIASCGAGFSNQLFIQAQGKVVRICCDNDSEGLKLGFHWQDLLAAAEIESEIVLPQTKDWNRDLQKFGVEGIKTHIAQICAIRR